MKNITDIVNKYLDDIEAWRHYDVNYYFFEDMIYVRRKGTKQYKEWDSVVKDKVLFHMQMEELLKP